MFIKRLLRPFYHIYKDLVNISVFLINGRNLGSKAQIIRKTLLLVRVDAIGDYVLFRNFIEEIKKSEQFHDYQITLLGNSAWRDLAENLDSAYIQNFIWVDRKKFLLDLKYQKNFLEEVSKQGYEYVIQPTYSREFHLGDKIVKSIRSTYKIGYDSDLSNIRPYQKLISNLFYNLIVPAQKEIIFEFERNKNFFQYLLKKKISLFKPEINISFINSIIDLKKKYAVLFIGGSHPSRRLNIESFSQIAHHIKVELNLNIVLAGGPEDIDDAKKFQSHFQNDFINIVGKTSFYELLPILKEASLLFSNETSAVHSAVAVNTKNIFVVSNGNHFMRFSPYPKNINLNIKYFWPLGFPGDLKNDAKIMNQPNPKYKNINTINIDECLQALSAIKESF